MVLKKIIQVIKRNKIFLVSTHTNPDPDGLCSELAIASYLRSLGKKVSIINEESTPGRFKFFPRSHEIKAYRKSQKLKCDVAIIVDCGDLARIGKVQNLITPRTIIINIDHHVTNDLFGHLNLIKPKASSTAEILYELLKLAKCPFDKRLAFYLYAGIMTDTGSFRYDNTTHYTHKIVGELMQFDFSVHELYRKLYEMIPLSDLKAFTEVISSFDALYGGRIICVELPKKILLKFSDAFDLRDTIFKFLRAIQGVEVVIIFTQVASNQTRVNFRSSGKMDVAELAHYFNGGGHKKASGCLIARDIKDSRKDVLKLIQKDL